MMAVARLGGNGGMLEEILIFLSSRRALNCLNFLGVVSDVNDITQSLAP